jgi:hypothetical protein
MSISDRKNLIARFSNVFARLHYKINFDITNTSSFLLAKDLLRDNTKRRLFKIVAVNVETLFLELLNKGIILNSSRANTLLNRAIKFFRSDILIIKN